MNYAWFEKIAPQLANPLVLVGFVLLLAYGVHWQLMKSGLLSKVDKKDSSLIIRLFLRYGFWLAMTLLLAGLVDWHWLAPKPSSPKSTTTTGNRSPAIKGTLIGYVVFAPEKSTSTTGNNSPAIIAEKSDVAVTYNSSGVPPELFAKYVKELAVTDSALANFFKILEQHQVPRSDLDSKLREIAASYKELLYRIEAVQSKDPDVVKLNKQVKQAIEVGDYTKAETLLEDIAKQYSSTATEVYAQLANLQEVQLRYVNAAVNWQIAAVILSEEKKKERLLYLSNAAYDLYRLARYAEAMSLWMQVGDKAGEAMASWNIGLTYKKQGNLKKAKPYMSRAVELAEEIGHPLLEEWRKGLERVRAKLRGR